MNFLLRLATLAGAFLLAHAAALAAPPNVVIVLVDDAGYGDYGCHGHPFLKTPNIDRLHAESVRFTDFHVAPMCTPTRGQLLTGQDALRNAAASVTAGRAILRPGIPTLPELLVKAGYKTGIFGKWHLGDNYPHRPMEKGFQEAKWLKGWGFTSAPEYTNTLFDGRYFHGDREERFPGYITDFCFNEAISWMRARGEKAEPFFCYLPLHAVHSPWVVADKYSAQVQDKVKGPASRFFGMLLNIDENMGRLEAFLRETGLRENTIVVFLNDNGGTGGVKFFNAGLRGHKTEYYDGGHVSPCFIRWPAGGLRPAGEIAEATQVQDLLPTLLELCGAPAATTPVDGRSLAPALRGKTEPLDRMLVVQFGASPPRPDAPVKGLACVIWDKWRLVHGAELYDMATDRAEERDVAAQHPEVVEKMRAHYEKWWAGIQPQLGQFVPITLGAEQANPVLLTSSDWQDLYADNSNHIRQAAGGPRGGPWNVQVERAGEYEVVLRRWPFDVKAALDAAPSADGKALPIAAATITVGGDSYEVKAKTGAEEISLSIKVKAGRTQLQAWFQDAEGKDLCGAFFARILRK